MTMFPEDIQLVADLGRASGNLSVAICDGRVPHDTFKAIARAQGFVDRALETITGLGEIHNIDLTDPDALEALAAHLRAEDRAEERAEADTKQSLRKVNLMGDEGPKREAE
jgi:precorrin-6B methylase 2